MSATEKSEFENVSGGWIGVQVKDDGHRGGFKGIALASGSRVWLDEEEQVATANKPRNDEDNPFVNGQLKLTASKQNMQNRRPIGDSAEPQAPAPQEPEATEEPQGDAEGQEGDEKPAEEQPQGEEPPKPEDEMTEAERAAHNTKAAAARAIPDKQTPPPPPAAGQEKVGTPEATAAAGQSEGQRAQGERVGTPDALKK